MSYGAEMLNLPATAYLKAAFNCSMLLQPVNSQTEY